MPLARSDATNGNGSASVIKPLRYIKDKLRVPNITRQVIRDAPPASHEPSAASRTSTHTLNSEADKATLHAFQGAKPKVMNLEMIY